MHWIVFRGGWAVLVFAADRKKLVRKVRCRDRQRAAEFRQAMVAQGLTLTAVG